MELNIINVYQRPNGGRVWFKLKLRVSNPIYDTCPSYDMHTCVHDLLQLDQYSEGCTCKGCVNQNSLRSPNVPPWTGPWYVFHVCHVLDILDRGYVYHYMIIQCPFRTAKT